MTLKYLTALVFSLMLVGHAYATEKVVIIVNAKNTQTLTAADVKNIYNDNVITWSSGARIAPYDLPVKSAARETFSQQILGASARDAAAEWSNKKITNTAKNPPAIKPESVVVNSVTKDADAIGYVPASAAVGKEGVRVILTLE